MQATFQHLTTQYSLLMTQDLFRTAYGIRTRVTAVKGRRPKPLDERGICLVVSH